MKLAVLTIASCLIFLSTLAGGTPAPTQDPGNGTALSTASGSMVDRFFTFQDQVKHWAAQLGQKARSAFQKLQVQEVKHVMSSWFSELGKSIRGFGKKTQ